MYRFLCGQSQLWSWEHRLIALSLVASKQTALPNSDLVYVTVSAIGTAGEIINAIQDPLFTGIAGGRGPHEVWVPISSAHTATIGDQPPIQWVGAYSPYDTYFLIPPTDYLAGGPSWDETNNGATTNTLGLPATYGARQSGFGVYGVKAAQ